MGANGDGALLREARLATIMPREVGYPAVLGSGVLDDYEWVVAERLLGVDLGVLWATMDDAHRRNALEDLWARLAAVHRTDIAQAQRLG
jgi:aminoglycoside phosphotransferase